MRVLEDSPRCRVTERGSIIVGFDDEVEVGLDVRKTVMRKESSPESLIGTRTTWTIW